MYADVLSKANVSYLKFLLPFREIAKQMMVGVGGGGGRGGGARKEKPIIYTGY